MSADQSAVKSGDKDPWSQAAVEQNQRWLTAYVLASTGNRAAADDVVQEVFRVALEKRDTFTAGTNFGGWLRVIAKNCLLSYYRQRDRQPVLGTEALNSVAAAAVADEDESFDEVRQASRWAALRTCLGEVPEKARAMLHRKYLDSWSSEQIAQAFRIQVAAVNTTMYRMRKALAACVERKVKP